ncbi:hypothetical protein H0H81_006816 [Sphagnurus paluster]|uniref:F-box domain-containing protein n=1 Tax=Sphagnurus paluster TaxID=117069 RepID=A0A9P7K5C7_9AGAR|nr:hypothetical protein H0H81_006816 [Sphagnurus paluster]
MTILLHGRHLHTHGHPLNDLSNINTRNSEASRVLLFRRAQRDLYDSLRLINHNAPIGSLPPEILGQIFETANQSNAKENTRPWDHLCRRKPLPIIISQVSSHWRDVALNSPLLWSEINISPPWSLRIIALFLARSKACPIHLNLTIPTIAFGNLLTPTVVNASAYILCDMVAQHIPRCRKITIKGDFNRLEPLLDAIMSTIHPSKAPHLEQLVLQVTGTSDFLAGFSAPLFIESPKLNHLRITSPMVPCLPSLEHVTSLHLALGNTNGIEFATLAALAKLCPCLETLALYDDVVCSPWPEAATVDLPSLRSLQVYGTFTSVSDLLKVISAPLLENLVIAPILARDLLEYHNHVVASKPTLPKLKSITLSPVSPSGFALLAMAAECFPYVERLTIPNIHPDSFRDIFTDADAEVIWPHLSEIALRNIDSESMETLFSIISFREAVGQPLRKLCLDRRSLQRIGPVMHALPWNIEIVESDVWFSLRDEDLLYEPAHFVGSDFDFID